MEDTRSLSARLNDEFTQWKLKWGGAQADAETVYGFLSAIRRANEDKVRSFLTSGDPTFLSILIKYEFDLRAYPRVRDVAINISKKEIDAVEKRIDDEIKAYAEAHPRIESDSVYAPLLSDKQRTLPDCILALDLAWSFGKARRIAEANLKQWFNTNKDALSEKDLNSFLLTLENYYSVSDITKFLGKNSDFLKKIRSKGLGTDVDLEKYSKIQSAIARIDRKKVTEAHLKARALNECNNIVTVADPNLADINAKDPTGSTLLHRIIEDLHPNMLDGEIERIFQRLKELGADFNARNNAGDTPLHIAARRNLTRAMNDESVGMKITGGAVFILLDSFGAIPELPNGNGEIPFDLAEGMYTLRTYLDRQATVLHKWIAKRNSTAFFDRLDVERLSQEHKLFGTPVEYIQKLLKDYEDIKYLRTPRQWYRNRQLKKMLEAALNYAVGKVQEVKGQGEISEETTKIITLLNQFPSDLLVKKLSPLVANDLALARFLEKYNQENYPNLQQAISALKSNYIPYRSQKVWPVASGVSVATSFDRLPGQIPGVDLAYATLTQIYDCESPHLVHAFAGMLEGSCHIAEIKKALIKFSVEKLDGAMPKCFIRETDQENFPKIMQVFRKLEAKAKQDAEVNVDSRDSSPTFLRAASSASASTSPFHNSSNATKPLDPNASVHSAVREPYSRKK